MRAACQYVTEHGALDDIPIPAWLRPLSEESPNPPAWPAYPPLTSKVHRMKLQTLPSIGTPFEGGFFGGIVRVGAVLFAIAWAPKAAGETKGAWLPDYQNAPGTDSCSDSLANTLAKWALDLRINGHDDWCLPARDVLELAYRHLKPTAQETYGYFRDGDNPSSVPAGYPYKAAPIVQTPVHAFQAGNAEAFEEGWYWASTQYSESSAWGQDFGNGTQLSYVKVYEGLARAVRLIQLDA